MYNVAQIQCTSAVQGNDKQQNERTGMNKDTRIERPAKELATCGDDNETCSTDNSEGNRSGNEW